MNYHELERLFGQRSTRRRFLFTAGALAGLAVVPPLARESDPHGRPWYPKMARPRFSAYPFSLGVASGDPRPDGVVLWTRLAPEPLMADGGMPPQPVEVTWQMAEDEALRRVVRSGTALARPDWAHAIHVEVDGLEPARDYWYRFVVGGVESPVGRTRTAPAPGAPVDRFRFAFVSCQNWQQGLYTAYRDLARVPAEGGWGFDLVVHLGDYIYESRIPENGGVRGQRLPFEVRAEPKGLDEYRLRYALYKSDPHLQAAHAAAPWILTWDDHEVMNDYADRFAAGYNPEDVRAFLLRRAAAYQAYFEHQPLRLAQQPVGPDLRLFRRLAFGDLVEFHVLDTRQYRSRQHGRCAADERAANGGYCAAALDPTRTILGADQRAWLLDGLAATRARWSVLANQVPFAPLNLSLNPAAPNYGGDGDKWDGYAADRAAVLAALAAQRGRGVEPIVITGDIHANAVYELKYNPDTPPGDPFYATVDAAAPTVGTEFVGTSISSGGDDPHPVIGRLTLCGPSPTNPHLRLLDAHRGYVACTVTPTEWRADYRALPSVRDPDAVAFTLATFVVEAGQPGTHLDGRCGP